jgi:hypothetical protein
VPAPDLSVILVCDDYDQVRRSVGDLAADPVAPRAEVVLVGPREPGVEVPADVRARLGAVQALAVDDHRTMHRARLAGVEAASAPVVVLAETHAWPEPGSLAALADAVRDGCAVAGPLMRNANPGTRASWAAFLLDYGWWWEGIAAGGEGRSVPGHSCAWSRRALLDRAAGEPGALRVPYLLAERLRAEGARVRLEPRARTAHLNADLPRSFLGERVVSGRFLGAARGQQWPAARRAVYALGSPLIVPLRLYRLARLLGGTREGRRMLRHAFPSLVAGTLAGAAGEALGYLTGRADDRAEAEYELAKERHASAPS